MDRRVPTSPRAVDQPSSVAIWTTLLCVGLRLSPRLLAVAEAATAVAVCASLRCSYCLPFWTSALIKNFSWLVLLGRNGIMAKTIAAIGKKGGDHLLFSRTTVVFAMVHTFCCRSRS